MKKFLSLLLLSPLFMLAEESEIVKAPEQQTITQEKDELVVLHAFYEDEAQAPIAEEETPAAQ